MGDECHAPRHADAFTHRAAAAAGHRLSMRDLRRRKCLDLREAHATFIIGAHARAPHYSSDIGAAGRVCFGMPLPANEIVGRRFIADGNEQVIVGDR